MSDVEGVEFSFNRERTSKGSISELSEQATDSYMLIPYGFQPRSCYKPKGKSKEITGVTYNSRSKQFIIIDSKGIAAWSHNSIINAVSRLVDYPPYQFNLIQLILHCKKFNVYFGLSKDYALKVFNINFHEVFSVTSDMNSVLCMVFNSTTDELITGGTGGIKFWTFGKIQSDNRSLSKDARPMANYGLILRREHPAVNGAMVKDIILDEKNQRFYGLSERNVVAHDMKGNVLFELKSAHQGQVTGCVYSKFSNFVVTAGTDCAVNVWSSNGGCLHSFCSHSKIVTNLLLHPEAPSLVITSSQDGVVKIFSLDIMEEIYSQVVFTEAIEWMNFIAQDLLYCATSKVLQVFSINHVTNFWTTVRCPLRSISLTAGSHGKRKKVLAIAEDYSARFVSKDGRLQSTVLPPPRVTTGQQLCSAHAYCQIYGLMYVLVNEEEIWVYYTKSNPANRVEVWNLSDMQDISTNRESSSRGDSNKCYTPASSRAQSSPSPFNPPVKVVNGVPCLSLAFLHSTVNLKNKAGERYPDLTYYLVVGLQDGRLLFTSAFSALVLYYQFQATKGAVLSIKHDENANLLLLNTMTLNKYSIQIRNLPDLDIKHSIEAGNNLTCFVRMGWSLLTGHETGSLNLYRLNPKQACEVEEKRFDGHKIPKDHLDSVLTVDANDELQLFCSCSKDGSIKIWNHSKFLLREIIMDKTLTSVCFLNSSGDLLAGFKNHIFSISHEKAHLISYCKSSRRDNELQETDSDIYEDPRVRFEYKKTIPSEPVHMETYLVPFANVSIDLGRFLSGQLPQSSLENDMESDDDETKSEFSDVFSVAPTDIYMSQSGTPHLRSRSSSLASSWNLPNLSASPVSSPPRTPPPFMSPVLELECEDEMAKPADNEALDGSPDNNFARDNEAAKTQTSKKDVKPTPIFFRPKRPGLSDWKIDSRSLQSKASVNVTKNFNSLRNERAKQEYTTSTTKSSRSGRTIVKKTKKQTRKLQGKIIKSRQLSFGNSMTKNGNQEENEVERNSNEENPPDDERENATVILIEERQLREEAQENTTFVCVEKKTDSQTFHEKVLGEVCFDQEHIKEQVVGVLKAENEGLNGTAAEESFAGTEGVESVEEKLLVISNSKHDERNECTSIGYGENNYDKTDQNKVKLKEDALPQRVEVSRKVSLNYGMRNLDLQELHGQLRLPGNSTGLDDDWINDVEQKESHVSLKRELESEHEDKSENRSEKPDKLNSKSVSFVVEKASVHQRSGPTRSDPQRKISNRHSVPPVNSTQKVVPVLDTLSSPMSYGRRLHPSSALKIYALAKTHQRTTSGRSLVTTPLEKQRNFVKHNTSEMSIDVDLAINDGVVRDFGSIPNTFVDTSGHGRVPNTFVDTSGHGRIPNTNVDTQTDRVVAKDKEGHKDEKNLINWCINALSEKSRYPIFSPKPRLRSRRSELRDEVQSTHDLVSKTHDIHAIPDAKKTTKKRRERESQHGFESGLEEKFNHLFYIERFQRETSRNAEASFALDYGEGWQERRLEKTRTMKAKYLERKQKVLEKRLVDKQTLEDKKHLVERVKGRPESYVVKVDKTHGSFGVDMNKDDRINIDNRVNQKTQSDGKGLNRVKSNYENFKNNPVIIQPYRLERSDATKGELLLRELNLDVNTTELPDRLVELIPRPKSAPSIPSKCRKYVLVDNDSQKSRDIPVPTALEEMLMLERFPKSDLGKSKSRSCSPFVSQIKRPYLLQKMQDVNMS